MNTPKCLLPAPRRRVFGHRLVVLFGLLAIVVGCQEKDPALLVESLRAQYTAQAQSFYIDERVVEAEPVLDSEGQEVSIEPTVERDLLLDIVVKNGSQSRLETLTVEYEHYDSSENLKDTRRMVLDVGHILAGTVGQFSETIENVDYNEGDKFSMSIRNPVPAAERSEYPEFTASRDS